MKKGIQILLVMVMVISIIAMSVGGCAKEAEAPGAPTRITPQVPTAPVTPAPVTPAPAKPSPAPAPEAEVFKWRMQSHWPLAESAYTYLCVERVNALREMSGGRLDITGYPGGAVIPTPEILESVGEGLIEMATASSGYFKGVIPLDNIPQGLPMGFTERWQALQFMYGKYFAEQGASRYPYPYELSLRDMLIEDFAEHNVQYFVWGVFDTGLMTNKPIYSMEDLNGMKIRSYGLMAAWLEQCGAATTYIPGEEIYTALATGVVEGGHWGCAPGMWDMKFHEILKYYMWPHPIISSWNNLLINMDAWNSLPDDLKLLIDTYVTHGTYIWSAGPETENVFRAIAMMEKDYGVTKVTVSPEELAKMRDKAMVVWEEAAAAGPRCKIAVDLYKQYMRDLGLIE